MMPKVLYCFPTKAGQSFCPSNGTEGMIFVDAFCCNCIHEKFCHTQDHADMKCDIFSRTMLHRPGEPGYPEEWQFDKDGWPICTAWKKWDWGRDDDGNFIDPPPVYPDDPNQLCLPFIFDEIGINEVSKHQRTPVIAEGICV